ncbi:histidine phosphatase family protein [Pseudooceanicola nanhaiensis]|uniref:histidine phosphatase family protein n=1 Tax=Pseudooceanicola nanhaiensis TaxID=375761 RepID=UPI001CD1C91F|nr:histidine phosphatase family protein [Pseudooceanicola nanhaiensis]MCA0922893.1 phosphoglycerate mutase family protein [Pseudooceanicola nanhaiensis]
MPRMIRYLTHPQVTVDPAIEVPRWSLNATGRARVAALAAAPGALRATTRIISSDETKAIETATPLAEALGLRVEVRPGLHENDRSATGFLPPDAFEAVADAFFAAPDTSVRGWETAFAAQARILAGVTACLAEPSEGDVLFVGHGGVGTLLYCALAGLPIDRQHDQGPGGGGCWFGFAPGGRPAAGWEAMETLSAP